ncbi:hypothetical protein [Streptomyces sp. NPDC054940]
MAFNVAPEDLAAYGRMIQRAAEDAHEGKRYLDKYSDIGGADQGLFTRPFDFHGTLVSNVTTVFSRLHTILNASSGELGRSASYYRETDQVEAGRIDGVQPDVKR